MPSLIFLVKDYPARRSGWSELQYRSRADTGISTLEPIRRMMSCLLATR